MALEAAIVPANEVSWEDLQAVFGARGDPSRCWCQRFRMAPKESWASVGAPELARRFREQTACGNAESETTSGLVAYLDGEPVGWCGVDRRCAHPRLLRNNRVPWEGRDEDKNDDSVWAVTCFVTRAGYRKRGRRLRARAGDRRLRAGARCPGARGLPDAHDAGPGDHVGRGPRRKPQHLRRCRLHGGQPPDPAARRDADRLLDSKPSPGGSLRDTLVCPSGEPRRSPPTNGGKPCQQKKVGPPRTSTLTADDGSTVTLSALQGQPVVLYFYPKDDTPGCTAQACGIRDAWGAFEERGAVVLGVSPDPRELAREVQGEVRPPVHAARGHRSRGRRRVRRLGREELRGQDVLGQRALDLRHRRGRATSRRSCGTSSPTRTPTRSSPRCPSRR